MIRFLKTIIIVKFFLCSCAMSPPTIKTVIDLQHNIQQKLDLPTEGFFVPIIMTENSSRFVIDGNGTSLIYLQRDYHIGILIHEICHAVQWRHGLPLDERTCQWMEIILNSKRPRWNISSH